MSTVAPWSPPPTLNPAVYYDLFPSIVTMPSGTVYEKARIVLTAPPSPRLYVFVDGPQGPGAAVIAEYEPARVFGSSAEGFNVILTAPNPSPILVTIRPMTGCGCGTSVKGMLPFTAMRHSAPPPVEGALADYVHALGVPLPAPAPAP